MCRAMLREKAPGAFEIMAIALKARLFEPVGNSLAFDDAERGIRARFATGGQLFDALTDLIQNWSFSESFPRRHESNRCDRIFLSFFSGFEHRRGIDKAVTRSGRRIGGRLRAEAAILRAAAGLGIHDRAKMHL